MKKEIYSVLPIEPILLDRKKIYLFHDFSQTIDYRLYTDGMIEHLDTWMDKKPYRIDPFLENASTTRRYEFSLQEASVLLIEKEYQEKRISHLYIQEKNMLKFACDSAFEIGIGNNNNIKVKRIGRLEWKLKE